MNILTFTVANASFGFFADLAVKATVLLFLAGIVGFILRRQSAATRHAVCALTAGALLLLPVLVSVSPDWRMAVLPSETMTAPRAEYHATTERTGDASPAAVTPATTVANAERTSVALSADTVSQAEPASLVTAADSNAGPLPITARESAVSFPVLDWRSGVVVLWLGGTFLLLTTVLGAHARVACLVRRARRFPEGHRIVKQLAGAARLLGVKRTITLRLTARNGIPFTCGLRRPTIVLPEAAENWSEERVQAVLLHELAHVKRRDCLTQFIAQTCVALYWFHPLAWLLSRRMRIEREKACDDLVLNAGIHPTQYGETLLSVASNGESRTGTPYVALAMAKKSSLETRLLAIMNTQQNRNPLRRTALAFGLIACAAAAMMIASVRLTADEVPVETADTPGLASENDETSVIRFTGWLEIRHETHGTLLHELLDFEVTLLSGQSNVHSSTDRGFTSTLSMEGTLVDGSIDLSGNVQIRQQGGFRVDDQVTFHRMDRPFSATLSLSEGEQRIEVGRDREGRIVSLFLTPTVLGKEARVEWLLDEIGRSYQSGWGSRRRSVGTASNASLLEHAKALHAAAEGIVSTERTQRLVEAFASLHESDVNDDREGIEESLVSIPRIGNALREDFDAWKAATRAADDPFADGAGRAGGASLFSRPSTMFGEPSTGHDEEATRDAETPPAPAGPVVEEKTMLRITVLGEVNRPGVYELDPGSTIIHALGHAGGWTGTARLNRVQIHRGPERLLTDVDAMLFGDGDVMSIEDGDVIIVTVRVTEYAPREITLLGAVRSPGTQEFPIERNDMDIVEVVARAGGFTRIARSHAVSVTRTEENGRERTFTVDVNSMVTGSRGGSEERFKILPGDVIWVPERVF